MNKRNLPWSREWEQLDLDIEKDNDSILKTFLSVLAFIFMSLVCGYFFAQGLVAEADLAHARAEGAKAGRLELLQHVRHETEREGKTWTAFYRAASKPGMSGFDGVLLVENK